jgi:hypothetical protein
MKRHDVTDPVTLSLATRDYLARRCAERKIWREAPRCLERHLVRAVFKLPKAISANACPIDEAYERFQSLPDDFIDAGAAVLVVTQIEWRGKRSGAYGQTPVVAAFWLRAGKVYREETFTDRAEAIEAVGLSE